MRSLKVCIAHFTDKRSEVIGTFYYDDDEGFDDLLNQAMQRQLKDPALNFFDFVPAYPAGELKTDIQRNEDGTD